MHLSIVIPTLNEVENVRTLCQKRAQEIERVEVIVVDAASSSDEMEEVCREYGLRYCRSKEIGRAKQMNQGGLLATGENVMFLHADVIPPLDFDRLVGEAIQTGNSMGFFAYRFSPSNGWLDINARYTARDGLFAGGGDQCQFFEKSVWLDLGMYNTEYVIMEDFELMRRVRREDIIYTIIQQPAIVSSRKYDNNTYLWVNLVNLLAFLAFILGVSPFRVKRFYSSALS